MRVATGVVLLLGLALAANAIPQPRVDQPTEGAILGPSYEIIGSVGERALVVVLTDVVMVETGRTVGTVPGIRHYSKNDGSFHFRCASPRVPTGDETTEYAYRVRCFVVAPGGARGPETVVNCKPASRSNRDNPAWSRIDQGEWTLKLLNDHRAVEGSRITAGFADGRIGGHAGINQYFGTFKVDGASMDISELGSTKMAGPPELMMQEQEYFAALEAVRGFQARGSELVLWNADGKIIVAYGRNAPGTETP